MELKIEVPKGYEIDKEKSTFEKIVFKEIENKLPTSVEEIKTNSKFYYYIVSGGIVEETPCTSRDKNDLSTKERAEAFLALMQLVELRDAWNGDSERHNCFLSVYNSRSVYNDLLTFKNSKLRDQFEIQFKDLIETAKELL